MSRRVTRISRKLNPGVYERPDGKIQALLKIPADLQFAYRRTQRVVSLHTDDPAEANRRHAAEVSKDQAAFESLRRGTASSSFETFARNLHAAQTREIARVSEEQLAARTPSPNVYTAPDLVARLNTANPEELAATVGWAADAFFAQQMNISHLLLPDTLHQSAVYRQVLRECAEVLKDSWRAGRELETGRAVTPPRYPALRSETEVSVDGNRARDQRAAWPLSGYFSDVYQPDHQGEIEDGTAKIPETTSIIFPGVVDEARDANGNLSEDKLDGSSVFRQFNRTILKHVGLDRDPTVSLHSFRHVFEDAMTGKNIPDEVMFRLTGRATGGSRAIYAKSLPADEERRAQRAAEYLPHVARIDFGGLDISHLHRSPRSPTKRS